MTRTTFVPATHGFHFANTFDNHRFIGPLHTDFTGRCGGMCYAAADYYWAHVPIPTTRERPVEGSVLGTYISARQDQSINNTLDKWIELDFNPFGWRTAEFFHWGLQETGGGRAQQLKAEIDRGRPAHLGLFNPGDLVKHHQVLAIGYEGAGPELRIFVYDPNVPDRERVLRPHPDKLRWLFDGVDYADPTQIQWLTYFVDLNYRSRSPSEALAAAPVAHLSSQNLSGQNLSQKDYRGAVCIATNFTGCTINQTDFDGATLDRAVFRGANLRNTNFSRTSMIGVDLTGADLKDTQLLHANLRGAALVGADCKLADFSDATLDLCDAHGADLHRAVLARCHADGASFYGASLNTANLAGARLRGANLTGADLRGADLTGADFTGASLSGANLGGAIRTGATGLP